MKINVLDQFTITLLSSYLEILQIFWHIINCYCLTIETVNAILTTEIQKT